MVVLHPTDFLLSSVAIIIDWILLFNEFILLILEFLFIENFKSFLSVFHLIDLNFLLRSQFVYHA